MKTINITPNMRTQASKFLKLRKAGDTSLYTRRGGFKDDDIIVGALAELAVYKLFKDYNIDCSKPDFTEHGKKKSYTSDLKSSCYNLHVKGQSIDSVNKYGRSWLVQQKDPIFCNEIESLTYDYFIPTVVDLELKKVYIYGIFSVVQLREREDLSFGECVVPMFRRTKKAVYLENLEFISDKHRWALIKKLGG